MFRKILVATDFSAVSRAALDTAERLAREQQASLHLVTVVRNFATEPWVVESVGIDFGGLLARTRAEAQRALTALSAGHASMPNVVTRVLVGDAADQIVHYARTAGIDLIVVGSHGRRGLSRAMLGSVAERVAREAACPVLIVRRSRKSRGHARHAA